MACFAPSRGVTAIWLWTQGEASLVIAGAEPFTQISRSRKEKGRFGERPFINQSIGEHRPTKASGGLLEMTYSENKKPKQPDYHLSCASQRIEPEMTPLQGALAMAAIGFPVFPVKPGTKGGKGEHLTKSWKAAATVDPAHIQAIADRFPNCNWGMRCVGHLVLDIDVADGKAGDASFFDLEMAHGLPRTRSHRSARGGSHVIFSLPPGVEVSNRDEPVGAGINVRGAGGYIMAPGSTFAGRPYAVADAAPIAAAPASLIALLKAPTAVKGADLPEELADHPSAIGTALSWLEHRPVAMKGERGSQVYKAAARLRDWGISRDTSLQLIADYFGARCEPPMHDGDGEHGCRHEVFSAYKNAQNSAGTRSVAADFEDMSDLAAELEAEATEAGAAPVARGVKLLWPVYIKLKAKDPETGKAERRLDVGSIDNIKAGLAFTGTTVWFDEFAGKTHIMSNYFGFDGELTDQRRERVRLDAFGRGLRCPDTHYGKVVEDIAYQTKRHPVREYLAGLKWDGVPRVAGLFPRYTGSPDTPLNRAAGSLLMVAAVRRVKQPGCKFDFMTVLEGPQGSGKSSFVAVLSRGWHSENFDLGDKAREVIEQTRGKWVVEIPELSGLSTSRGGEHIKALITRTHDEARGAYARTAESVPRQWVLIATTNDRRYLSDPTGNRRYLPIEAPTINFAALKRDLDQLWAEATVLEKNYGPLVLPKAVRGELAAAQNEREELDPIRETLEPLLWDARGFLPSEDLWEILGHPRDRPKPSTREMKRFAGVMHRMGWESVRPRAGGPKVSGFRRWDDPNTPAPRLSQIALRAALSQNSDDAANALPDLLS